MRGEKKGFFLGILLVFMSGITSFGQYCVPQGNCTDTIYLVSVANLSLEPVCSTTGPGYSFYDTDTVFVQSGVDHVIEAFAWSFNTDVALWFDADMDQEFTTDEFFKLVNTPGFTTKTGILSVPETFTPGSVTRMRLAAFINADQGLTACDGLLYETWQYIDVMVKATADYCMVAEAPKEFPITNCDDTTSTLDTYILETELVNQFTNSSNTCGVTRQGYSDYTSIFGSIGEDEEYTLNVDLYSEGNAYQSAAVWIDWNNDSTFEASERLVSPTPPLSNTWVFNGTFTSQGYFGPTRMRVIGYWDYPDYQIQPCGIYSQGETEDYTIYLTSANTPACAETPLPADASTGVCPSLDTLKWSHADAANVEGYYVSLGTATGNYDVFSGVDAGANTFLVLQNSLMNDTEYFWKVEPYVGTEVAPGCDEWTFTTTVNSSPKPEFYIGGVLASSPEVCVGEELEIKSVMTGGDGTLANGNWTSTNPNFVAIVDNDSVVFQADMSGATWIRNFVEDGNGCTGVDSIQVQVKPNPDTGSNSDQIVEFCEEAVHTFSVQGTSGTIQWQDSLSGGMWTDVVDSTQQTFTIAFSSNSQRQERYIRAVLTENGCSAEGEVSGLVVHPLPEMPSITVTESAVICPNDSAVLTTPTVSDSLVWLPSEKDANVEELVIYDATTVVLRNVDRVSGCFSDASVEITTEAAPDTPIMDPSLDQTVCSASLPKEFKVINPAIAVQWMDGSTGTTLLLDEETAEIFVTNVSANGCKSVSDTISLTVTNQPDPPLIEIPSGENSFCEGDSILVRVSNYMDNLFWSDGGTGFQRYLKTGGAFTVTFGDDPTCQAISQEFTIQMLEAPDDIQISEFGNNPGCVGDSVLLVATNYDEVAWNNSFNTINDSLIVTTTGNYRATVENANGCTKSHTTEVVLDEYPEEPVITIASDGDCPGDRKTLTTDVPVQWNDANATFGTSIEVFENGTYTATVSNGICATTSSVEIMYAGAPEDPQIVFTNDTLFVTPVGQEFYTWYLNGEEVATTTEPYLTDLDAGEYTVTYTSTSGCLSSTSSGTIVGVTEYFLNTQLHIYPNPGHGIYHVNMEVDAVEAYDAMGRKLKLTYQDGKIILPHAKGVYLLKLSLDGHQVHRKIIQQ